MQLKVLTWNIWKGKHLPEVIELLKRINPDVIGLQEVMEYESDSKKINSSQQIAHELDFHFVYFPAVHNTRHEIPYDQGNAILSRYEIQNEQCIFLSDINQYLENAETEPRIAVSADIQLGKEKIRIFTTHLAYSPYFKSTPIRQQQVEKLLKYLPQKGAILMGDFNSHPDSEEVQLISSMLKNAGPQFKSPTWTKYPFDYFGFKENELKHRIDYVFTTPDFQVLSSEILDSTGSDHLPILTILEK